MNQSNGMNVVDYKLVPLDYKNMIVIDVSCGGNHSALLTKNEEIYVAGLNDKG